MVRVSTSRILVRIPASKIVEFTRDVGSANFIAMPTLGGTQLCVVDGKFDMNKLSTLSYVLHIERGSRE